MFERKIPFLRRIQFILYNCARFEIRRRREVFNSKFIWLESSMFSFLTKSWMPLSRFVKFSFHGIPEWNILAEHPESRNKTLHRCTSIILDFLQNEQESSISISLCPSTVESRCSNISRKSRSIIKKKSEIYFEEKEK